MSGSEIAHRQKGQGHLILKNGMRGVVLWEINFHRDGSTSDGYVSGSDNLINRAADDGVARLSLGAEFSLDVTVGPYRDGRAPVAEAH